jgi:tRNA modification GTPase
MQLEGKHSNVYLSIKNEIVRLLAHVEAYIDFEADETTDLNHEVMSKVYKDAEKLISKLLVYLKQGEVSEAVREGFKIAIIGPPNAGKSTLMNLLA